MSENKKISAKEDKKNELERKALNKMKLLDAMTAFIISLVLFACAYGFLTKYIGAWALYAACVLSVVAVIILIKLTGLKMSLVFKMKYPSRWETVGCALSLASGLVLSMPLILFSQLLAPSLAATSFNVYSIVDKNGGTAAAIVLVFLIAICENVLFDGYIYSLLTGIKNVIVRAAFMSLMAAILHFDMYAFSTVFIMSLAAFFVRRSSDSVILAFVVRLCSASFVMAMSNVSATSSELVGEAMGALQIVGMSFIFVGIAVPAIAGAFGAFGKLCGRGKLVGFITGIVSILLIATGCGISSF